MFLRTLRVCFLFRTWFFLLGDAQGLSWFDFLLHFRSSLSAFSPLLSDLPFARLFFWLKLLFYLHVRNLDSALIVEVHSNVNFVPFVCKDPKHQTCVMHLKLPLAFWNSSFLHFCIQGKTMVVTSCLLFYLIYYYFYFKCVKANSYLCNSSHITVNHPCNHLKLETVVGSWRYSNSTLFKEDTLSSPTWSKSLESRNFEGM